jgi:hypothetical protein
MGTQFYLKAVAVPGEQSIETVIPFYDGDGNLRDQLPDASVTTVVTELHSRGDNPAGPPTDAMGRLELLAKRVAQDWNLVHRQATKHGGDGV